MKKITKVGISESVTPLRPRPSRAGISKVIKSTMKDYVRTMKKLA
ncbi:MAG TPA: hypothetical protein VH280_18420 [Verrucomicrobiae bacterium]|nr:hypothetical protein [Verrucomicrobiae bacterium]